MNRVVKVGIVATIIAIAVISYVTTITIGDMMGSHEGVDVYYLLYRVAPICGNIARVATAIYLPVIGVQVVNAIKKGE